MPNRDAGAERPPFRTVVVQGNEYRWWIRIDVLRERGFPEEMAGRLRNMWANPKFRVHMKKVMKGAVILDVELFNLLQSDFDILPDTAISVYLDPMDGRDAVPVGPQRANMHARDKKDYDQVLRLLRMAR